MDIKKANVNLLLGKIRAYLDAQPAEKKKGKRFIDAQKALVKLEKLFVEKAARLKSVPCSASKPSMGG
jgi:hypothetical protein